MIRAIEMLQCDGRGLLVRLLKLHNLKRLNNVSGTLRGPQSYFYSHRYAHPPTSTVCRQQAPRGAFCMQSANSVSHGMSALFHAWKVATRVCTLSDWTQALGLCFRLGWKHGQRCMKVRIRREVNWYPRCQRQEQRPFCIEKDVKPVLAAPEWSARRMHAVCCSNDVLYHAPILAFYLAHLPVKAYERLWYRLVIRYKVGFSDLVLFVGFIVWKNQSAWPVTQLHFGTLDKGRHASQEGFDHE